MVRLCTMLGLVVLLLSAPAMAYEIVPSHYGRGAVIAIDGRGMVPLKEPSGRGFEGRGSPVAIWGYADEDDSSVGECPYKDCCGRRRGMVQPHAGF